jgi:hypothetical protein
MAPATVDHVATALNALVPQTGFQHASSQQIQTADIHSQLAIATALDRIGAALEQIAANTTTDRAA